MKELIQKGTKLFTKTIVINILCFFLIISATMIISLFFSKTLGYNAYGIKGNETEQTKLYTYYYSEGEDLKKAEFEKDGYIISERPILSKMSKSGMNVFLLFMQLICLGITIPFVYNYSWNLGNSDISLVNSEKGKKDTFLGYKIGLISVIPQFLFLVLMVAFGLGLSKDFPIEIYKIFNAYSYSFIDWILGGISTAGQLNVIRVVLLFITLGIIPVISGISYKLGLDNNAVGEKLIYKKEVKK